MFAKESRNMRTSSQNSSSKVIAALMIALVWAWIAPASLSAIDKKNQKNQRTAAPAVTGPRIPANFDTSNLVWPGPPNIGRIKYLSYFAGMKIDYTPAADQPKKKQGWMDRLAGAQEKDEKQLLKEFPFQLIGPYGMAVDSKGQVYVADQRVGAVFIFNTETHDVTMIRNRYEASFGLINAVAIDDGDRLFVSDGKLHRVLIFDANHKVENQITEGLVDPVGMAIDTDNRLLYVVDTQLDQVLVYDVDTLKPVRRIGTGGKNHYLTTPGDFGAPSNVAVDKEGNVYVTDTMNNRVEIFNADGEFVSLFGKHGDGPGDFARPKGIAVDCDGHIWVADAMEDRLQVFNREGRLLAFVGGHGNNPGQFDALVGVFIDKQNRVFTTEQYPGRMQMFRYITDAEAAQEKARREAELEKKANRSQATPPAPKEKDNAAVKPPSSPAQ
jgi:DNA-binding beta-propeller fold protein YncE